MEKKFFIFTIFISWTSWSISQYMLTYSTIQLKYVPKCTCSILLTLCLWLVSTVEIQTLNLNLNMQRSWINYSISVEAQIEKTQGCPKIAYRFSHGNTSCSLQCEVCAYCLANFTKLSTIIVRLWSKIQDNRCRLNKDFFFYHYVNI